MSPDDEPGFIDLLRSVYSDTYSYKDLYRPGGYASLLSSGGFKALGEFDNQGRLVMHSGLIFKDPLGDFVESGISLRRPHARSMSRQDHGEVWDRVLDDLSLCHAFLHQNTTTYHPLAQRYAASLMRARPAGVISAYAREERVMGIDPGGRPMHALMMTTTLRVEGDRAQISYLPDGPWSSWAERIFMSLDLGRTVRRASPSAGADLEASLGAEAIESNPWLGLSRRRIVRANGRPPAAIAASERARVDLVHLPLADEAVVAAGARALHAQGYVPVGLRPGAARADELIFQWLPSPAEAARDVLDGARLASDAARRMVREWAEGCGLGGASKGG